MSLRSWAAATKPQTSPVSVRVTTQPSAASAPPPAPAGPVILMPGQVHNPAPVLYTPPSMPGGQIGLYGSPVGGNRGHFVANDPILPTVIICKKDKGAPDNYANFMRTRVDTMKANGLDYSGGFDATKMVSKPEGHAMGERLPWTENTKYWNGLTDKTAEDFNTLIAQRAGMSLGELRQSGTHTIRANANDGSGE